MNIQAINTYWITVLLFEDAVRELMREAEERHGRLKIDNDLHHAIQSKVHEKVLSRLNLHPDDRNAFREPLRNAVRLHFDIDVCGSEVSIKNASWEMRDGSHLKVTQPPECVPPSISDIDSFIPDLDIIRDKCSPEMIQWIANAFNCHAIERGSSDSRLASEYLLGEVSRR